MQNVAAELTGIALVMAADCSGGIGGDEMAPQLRGRARLVMSRASIKALRSGRPRCTARQAALVAVLSLYPLYAFAQSKTTQFENKPTASAGSPAATSPIPSDPPVCSLQTPCIEDPATGKRYQFDVSGKMTVIP